MESFDVYFKDSESGKPIFVYIHGGYWQTGTKEVSAYCVAPLVERGFKVIIVDYNLCPSVDLRTQMTQLKSGMDTILNYAYETKSSEVTICGHSAGAHLAASILDTPYKHKNLIKHFILISGIYDLSEIWNTKACAAISGVENPLGLTALSAKELSPMFYEKFADFSADFYLFTGKFEAPSFFGLAKAFKKVLEKHRFKVTQYVFPEYDHFDIVHSMKDRDSSIMKFVFSILGFNVLSKL